VDGEPGELLIQGESSVADSMEVQDHETEDVAKDEKSDVMDGTRRKSHQRLRLTVTTIIDGLTILLFSSNIGSHLLQMEKSGSSGQCVSIGILVNSVQPDCIGSNRDTELRPTIV